MLLLFMQYCYIFKKNGPVGSWGILLFISYFQSFYIAYTSLGLENRSNLSGPDSSIYHQGFFITLKNKRTESILIMTGVFATILFLSNLYRWVLSQHFLLLLCTHRECHLHFIPTMSSHYIFYIIIQRLCQYK